jgi:hypothetical protein
MAHYEYRVQHGDSLNSIAQRFGWSASESQRWWGIVLNQQENRWITSPKQLANNTKLIVPLSAVRQRFSGAIYVPDPPAAQTIAFSNRGLSLRLERVDPNLKGSAIPRITGFRG